MPVTWSLAGIQDWWWVSASEVLVPLLHRVVTNICSTVTQSCNKYTRDRVVGVDPPGLSVCCAALQCGRAPRNRFPTCTLHIALLWVGAPSDTRSPLLLAHQPPWVLNIPQWIKAAAPQPRYLDFKTLTAAHSNLIKWSSQYLSIGGLTICLVDTTRFPLSWKQRLPISLLCHHYDQHNSQHWPIKKVISTGANHFHPHHHHYVHQVCPQYIVPSSGWGWGSA